MKSDQGLIQKYGLGGAKVGEVLCPVGVWGCGPRKFFKIDSGF